MVDSQGALSLGLSPSILEILWGCLGAVDENLIQRSLAAFFLMLCILCGKYGLSVVLCLKVEKMSHLLLGYLNVSHFICP